MTARVRNVENLSSSRFHGGYRDATALAVPELTLNLWPTLYLCAYSAAEALAGCQVFILARRPDRRPGAANARDENSKRNEIKYRKSLKLNL